MVDESFEMVRSRGHRDWTKNMGLISDVDWAGDLISEGSRALG